MNLKQLLEQIKYIIREKQMDSTEALIEIADLIEEFEKSKRKLVGNMNWLNRMSQSNPNPPERIVDECPKCKSKNIHHYYSGNGEYDSDGDFVDFDSDGIYEASQCQDCGWENF